jgi:hypothetical protein
MTTEFLRDKAKSLTRILLAVAALLGALVFLQVAGFFVSSSKAQMMAAEVDPGCMGVDDLGKLRAATKASVEELRTKNLFVLAPARQHPVNEVIGILGNEVLINGKWYKTGESVGEAKIVAIEPTKVRIAWDGQEKEFSPIGSGGSGGRPDPRAMAGGRPGPGPGVPAKMVVTGSRQGPPREGQGLSPQDKESQRQRIMNMSEDEKQRYRDETRQKASRRGQ